MSCDKEGEVEDVSLDPEDGEGTNVCLDDPCSLQDLNLDPDMGSSQRSLSENGVETEDNSEFDSGSKLQAPESGIVVFQEHGEQSICSARNKGDLTDCLPLVNDKAENKVQPPTDEMSQDARSHSSSKSCATQQSTAWVDTVADCSRRDGLGKRLGDVKRASVAPLHHWAPKGGKACRTKKKKKTTKSKKTIPEDSQDPPSDPDSSSDEYNEMQVMRVTICFKNGEQITSGNSMAPENKIRKRNVQLGGNFHHMTGYLQMSAPRGQILDMGKPGASCSNRKPSVFRGKEQNRPRFPGAAEGALRKTSPKKKSAQEKKPLQDTPRVTGQRPVPLWGQKPKAASVEIATFPPITCVPTLESYKKHTTPLEATEPTSRNRAVAKNARETLPVAREDRGLVCKDTMKKSTMVTPTSEYYKVKEIAHAQVPPHRAEHPSVCMYRGEMSGGDSSTRAQVPGNSQPVALSQGGTNPRAFAPYGDQDTSVAPPLPVEEKQHQAPGILRCHQCPLLEKEACRLRKQLAVMQALNEKFQDL